MSLSVLMPTIYPNFSTDSISQQFSPSAFKESKKLLALEALNAACGCLTLDAKFLLNQLSTALSTFHFVP